MKKFLLTMAAALAFTAPAMAVTKSSASAMSFHEYVASVGCVIVDKGGYGIVRAADGVSFCDGMAGHLTPGVDPFGVDPDGIPNSGDEYQDVRSDR